MFTCNCEGYERDFKTLARLKKHEQAASHKRLTDSVFAKTVAAKKATEAAEKAAEKADEKKKLKLPRTMKRLLDTSVIVKALSNFSKLLKLEAA